MTPNGTGWRSADNSDPSRPATEVDYLFEVQVIVFCRLRSVCRNKSKSKEPKVEERFPSAAFVPTCLLCVVFSPNYMELLHHIFSRKMLSVRKNLNRSIFLSILSSRNNLLHSGGLNI